MYVCCERATDEKVEGDPTEREEEGNSMGLGISATEREGGGGVEAGESSEA